MKIMANKYLKICTLSAVMLTAVTGCDLNEKFYSETAPETFFTSKESVYAILARPFSHWQWYFRTAPVEGSNGGGWHINEGTADAMIIPTREVAGHWYNQGNFQQLQYHQWTAESTQMLGGYDAPMQGVARCLAAKESLDAVDYPSLGLTEADKADHFAQLDAMAAFFYKEGLDRFGGLPIYTSSRDALKARNTDKELFEHIENLLLDGMNGKLKKRTAGEAHTGYITQGAAAALLAQLYLNAEPYIGESRYTQCAKVCEDIIAGVYGSYAMESDWKAPYGFSNSTSNELIWAIPNTSNRAYNTFFWYCYPAGTRPYFGITTVGDPYNGWCLAPSRKLESDGVTETLYSVSNPEIKLGSPFEKFDNGDLRKQPYRYLGSNTWQGMFMMGDLIDYTTGNKFTIEGGKYDKMVDYVCWASLGQYVSNMNYGEQNSGYRLVKYPLKPETEVATRWDAYIPVIRLAEVKYMLAECKYRAGDKGGAATLINDIRERYFAGGADPNPVTAVNLDDYRMLDEWLIEFIGEAAGRRRTDLIRFDKFVTENWWDHTASNNRNLHRFPFHTSVLTGNPLIVQNPGY